MKNRIGLDIIGSFYSGRYHRAGGLDILSKIKSRDIPGGIKRVFFSPYFYVVLGILVGLLVSLQFKTESSRPLNPVLSYNRFADLQSDYSQERERLRKDIANIKSSIAEKEDKNKLKSGIPNAMILEIGDQKMIAGETTVYGEGVMIHLSDGESQVKDEITKSLVHAADLRDIVNLLWYSGAEAISINGERVVYNTSIDCIVSTILINTNNYAPPFTIKAIGSTADLYGVLNGSRKLVDIKKRASKKQIDFSIEKNNKIVIDKFNGV